MDYSYVEVMKVKSRMCKTYRGFCEKCDISSDNNGKNIGCGSFISEYPQEAQNIIMKWAEEHKVKTNLDVFCEVFGVDKKDVDIIECPLYHGECCNNYTDLDGCKHCKYNDWWQQEYKEK